MIAKLNINSGELTTIRLYGKLGAMFGRVHRMAVGSAAEAVSALSSQLEGFSEHLTRSKDDGYGYAVFYGKRNLTEDDLRDPTFGDDIRIAPIVMGSKSGGWFNVIVGVVLVAVGAVLTWFGGGVIGVPMMKMGAAIAIGGVIQLLAPVPGGISARDRPENQPSYAFNGPINTQAQGGCVPVVYGENITGSAVLSAGINAVDQAYIPRGGTQSGSGGGGGGGAPAWHEEFN